MSITHSIDPHEHDRSEDTRRTPPAEVRALVARMGEPSGDEDAATLPTYAIDLLSRASSDGEDAVALMRRLYGDGDADGARRIGALLVAAPAALRDEAGVDDGWPDPFGGLIPVFEDERPTEDELELLDASDG